jgi:hypothetical protein
LVRDCQQARSLGRAARSELCRLAALAVWVVAISVVGCREAPPSKTDLSKTPWLDPKVQTEALKNQDFRIRGLAALHLGNMGAKAADALPELERLATDDPNAKVRENAQKAVDKIRAAAGASSG